MSPDVAAVSLLTSSHIHLRHPKKRSVYVHVHRRYSHISRIFFGAVSPKLFIKGDQHEKRKESNDKERNETATRLWEISCCDQNVFNKTNFLEA